jgi:putative hemolysin
MPPRNRRNRPPDAAGPDTDPSRDALVFLVAPRSMPLTSLFLFCACLLVSFLYSGIEAGLLSINRVRLKSRVQQDDRAAIRLDRLLSRPGWLLATVLLVTNFANVAALILLTNALTLRFGGRGIALAGVVMLPIYLLGVQLLPKSLFRRFPYRALAALAGLLELTSRLLSPLLTVGAWFFRRYAAPAAQTEPSASRGRHGLFVAREEFRSLADEGERTGALSPGEHRMIDHVMDFGTLRVADVMEPAPEPLVVREDMRVAHLLEFAREKNLAHVPVVETAAGELIALVDVFSVLFDRNPNRDAAIAYFRRAPILVAPGDASHRVLRRLRAARLNAAAVVDGPRLIGIVRTGALLQRLVRGAP